MKCAVICGMGLGVILGAYLIKNCPAAREIMDSATNAVKTKFCECKEKMNKRKDDDGESERSEA